MSQYNYQHVESMRRMWAPRVKGGSQYADESATELKKVDVGASLANGVYYQRCGGGRRVIRKRLTGS